MEDLTHIWQEAVRKAAPPPLWGFLLEATIVLGEGECLVQIPSEIGLDLVTSGSPAERLRHALMEGLGKDLPIRFEAGGEGAQPPPPPVVPMTLPVPPRPSGVKRGKPLKGRFVRPSEVEDAEGPVHLMGRVAYREVSERRDGGRTLKLSVTDFEDTVLVKFFLKPGEEPPAVEPGMDLRLSGDRSFDRFDRQWLVIARDLEADWPAPRHLPKDPSRIEFHLHTKFSTLDGITDLERLFSEAGRYGLKGVAITDHGVIQAFPDAYLLARRHQVDVILGVEAYVQEEPQPLLGGTSLPLGQDMVAVDVETTSLSPVTGEVIEVGACLFSGGAVKARFQSLIRPKGEISQETFELTGIDPEKLREAPLAEEVYGGFLAFLGDHPLVAHNAPFDRGFLLKTAQRLGLPFKKTVLDTLALGRILNPDMKNHRLPDLAAKYGVKLDRHHRADTDAETAGWVAVRMAEALKKEGVLDWNQVKGEGKSGGRPFHAQILAKNQDGLLELYRLVTRSHLEGYRRVPTMARGVLSDTPPGLLKGASGCPSGEIVRGLLSGDPWEELVQKARQYDYLEVLPPDRLADATDGGTGLDEERAREIIREVDRLGRETGLPVIAVSDAHHLDPQEARLRQIAHRAGPGWGSGKGGHLRTPKELVEAFSGVLESPEGAVFDGPDQVAQLVEKNLKPVPDGLHAPEIPGAVERVRDDSRARLDALYPAPCPEAVLDRFDREMAAILKNNFAPIYHIARLLTEKAKSDGEIVGSRGSVGSSFIAYLLGITEVNPLAPHWLCRGCTLEWGPEGVFSGYDLPEKICPTCQKVMEPDGQDIPFETFLGFEGDKVPDIDLNFSGPYQAEIHRAVETILGEGNVFRAGTIATVADRTAFGMVRGYLEESSRQVRPAEVDRLARGLVGAKRTTGQHPGGVMIVPEGEDVHRFTPLQHPADDAQAGTITTHFDYNAISSRLLKLDLLGHDDPTVIRLLSEITGIPVETVPFDDPQTMKIFSSTESLGTDPDAIGSKVGTFGVPEFGTRFVRQMLEVTKPQGFGELVRISGLSHGTDVWTNNAKELIEEGTATLREVIATRDDIMLTLIRQGLTPEKAFKISEAVRKGKGLKEDEEILLRRANVPEWAITSMKKIKYMFPKAHAAAYVMMAVRIAWFKVHYPAAFYASYFSVRADEIDLDAVRGAPADIRQRIKELDGRRDLTAKDKSLLTILEVVREMEARGIFFSPLDLDRSKAQGFLIEADGRLLPPLSVLPGLGRQGALQLAAARKEAPFRSVDDLKSRGRLSRPVIELLRREGYLDGLTDTDQMTLF